MSILLVGFDSAWTSTNSGALVGVLRLDNGRFQELGNPVVASFPQAEHIVLNWQADLKPSGTVIMIDQPTIVENSSRQRPVESIVGSPVGLRYGGMQPANTSKLEMFGPDAPIWRFLTAFGGPADPFSPITGTHVYETYPVLAIIALQWILPDETRLTGRLPKYNPERGATFSILDWQHVCRQTAEALGQHKLRQLAQSISRLATKPNPNKRDQDAVDACLCLLVALHLVADKDCMMVGNQETGYIVVPHAAQLISELEIRCRRTGRVSGEWVRTFKMMSRPC